MKRRVKAVPAVVGEVAVGTSWVVHDPWVPLVLYGPGVKVVVAGAS